MRILPIVFGIALSTAAYPAPTSSVPQGWDTYVNVRYGFSICYPANLLIAQGEADNGDGQTFKARDGAELRVFGSNNVLDRTAAGEAEDQARHHVGATGKITYRASKPDWQVISGDDGHTTVFYVKTVERDDQFITFLISYPKASGKRYGAVVNHLSRCFHLTEGQG